MNPILNNIMYYKNSPEHLVIVHVQYGYKLAKDLGGL